MKIVVPASLIYNKDPLPNKPIVITPYQVMPIVTPTPSPGPGSGPSPSPIPSTPIPLADQFHMGMHFHRLYNNGGESATPSTQPSFRYSVFRDWDCEGLHDAVVWASDGSINEALIRQVYEGHKSNGAKVLKCFGTVPTWASKRPEEANSSYPDWPGAKSGPRDLIEYKDYVKRFVTIFRDYLWGVEGWNEPYPDSAFPTSGSGSKSITIMSPADVGVMSLHSANHTGNITFGGEATLVARHNATPQQWHTLAIYWNFTYADPFPGYNVQIDDAAVQLYKDGVLLADNWEVGIPVGQKYTWEISQVGGAITVKLNGAVVITYTDATPITSGIVRFQALESTVMLDNLTGAIVQDFESFATGTYADGSVFGPITLADFPAGGECKIVGESGATPDWPQFTTMTPTELADTQKMLYLATKEVDPSMPVFSPAQAYVTGMNDLLAATTSDGEPITQFFDVVGWHPYNRDADGTTSANNTLLTEIGEVRAIMTSAGIGTRPLASTEHGWLGGGKEGGAAFRALTDAQRGQVLYDTAKVAHDNNLIAIIYYSYETDLIGTPMTVQPVAAKLDEAFVKFNTGFSIGGETPAPAPTPTPTPSPIPGFNAYVTQAPSDGATITGVVRISIAGENIQNAELLPEFGYLPQYAFFTLAADRKSAYCDFDTATVSDRTAKFRVAAWNSPPNGNGDEITVFTRSWTIDNVAGEEPGTGGGVSPSSIVVDMYGDSTMFGWDGATDAQAVNPIPKQLGDAFPGMTVRNEGVNSTDTTQLLNGTDGKHPAWTTQMTNSNATHVICNHGINDWIDEGVYVQNLRTLHNEAKAKGKQFIFYTPNPVKLSLQGGGDDGNIWIDNRAQNMRDLATELGAPLIDVHKFWKDWLAADATRTVEMIVPDGLHPTQARYDQVFPFVQERFVAITGVANGGTTNPNPNPTPVPPTSDIQMAGPVSTNYQMTFVDDFDGTTLSNKWGRGYWFQERATPPGTLRIANGELQMCAMPDSMFTGANDAGYCIIGTDPDTVSPGFMQKYGVFQIECKLPAGKGYWPSFWLYAHPGNNRPEVDVFETYAGGDSGEGGWTLAGTPPKPKRGDISIHPLMDPGGYQAPSFNKNMFTEFDGSAAFHKYTFEWDAGFMKFYMDGVLKQTANDPAMMAWMNQFAMFLYVGLGINYGTAGGPSTDQAVSPTGFGSDPANPNIGTFRVRHVAVWQHKKYL